MARTGKHALITTVAQLKARCIVDPSTHCWAWTGATSGHGRLRMPTLWAFDHARCEKRTMTGPLAAWNIAHGAAPLPGWRVFRTCGHTACLNPAHLREARSAAEIGQHIRRAGTRKGLNVEANRENIRAAWAATGIVPTAPHVVRAIRAADGSVTGRALAAQFGVSKQTVSRIRNGLSHRGVE